MAVEIFPTFENILGCHKLQGSVPLASNGLKPEILLKGWERLIRSAKFSAHFELRNHFLTGSQDVALAGPELAL